MTKSSSAKCFPIISKKLNFKKVKITTKDGCRWVVSMILAKGLGKISAVSYSRCMCCGKFENDMFKPLTVYFHRWNYSPSFTNHYNTSSTCTNITTTYSSPMPVGPAPSLCCPNVTSLGSEDISGVYSFVGMAISTFG